MCLMYHAACEVEPFNRSYSQLTFFNLYQIDSSSTMGTHQLHLAGFTYNCCTESYTPQPVDLTPISHLLCRM